MGVETSLVRIVEAAYRLDGAPADWLKNLARAAQPALDRGRGVVAYTYRLTADDRVTMDLPVVLDMEPATLAHLRPAHDEAPPDLVRRCFRAGPVLTLGDVTSRMPHPPPRNHLSTISGGTLADVWFVVATDGHDGGVALTAPTASIRRPGSAERAAWARVAHHLGSALRLHRHAHAGADAPDVELVLDGKLRVVHALGDARAAASALVERARTIARVRAHREPLELWPALLAGRWSLVDWIDRDGKRFVVARRNTPDVRDPRTLGERERLVVAYVALGHRNKEIAYGLGLAEGTVGRYVAQAMRKLGVRRREELIALRAALARSHAVDESTVVGVVHDVAPPSALSRAEREVAVLAARGRSARAIAASRGVAVRTVTNQIASVFRKLGVSTRAELAAYLLSAR